MGLFGASKKEKQLQSEIERLNELLAPEHNDIAALQDKIRLLQEEVASYDTEIQEKAKTIDILKDDIAAFEKKRKELKREISCLNTDMDILEYGLYSPSYVFANSDHYKAELISVRDAQKRLIKDDKACYGNSGWTVNGSESKGRTMVKDTKKLLLRAFNVECDDIVANVKVSNFDKSVERIYKISEQISRLGNIMSISIRPEYIRLKVEEVKLALDFQQKKQEEKERLKELKEQQREAAKVQKEIDEERKKLAKEQAQYKNALSNLLSQIEKNGETPELLAKKEELQSQLGEIDKAIEDVDYRAANQKAGYVYIISNIGSFGENVYKIGMTRRLNPLERVDELGDASVPFNFDVHALIFTEDAPKLESALHHAFEERKLNKINTRREFFKVSLDEIKAEVQKNFDKTVEWIDVAEAEQFRQSQLL